MVDAKKLLRGKEFDSEKSKGMLRKYFAWIVRRVARRMAHKTVYRITYARVIRHAAWGAVYESLMEETGWPGLNAVKARIESSERTRPIRAIAALWPGHP